MTTPNLRLAFINLADSATLTASPVASALGPVTYLQNDSRSYVFLAGASGSQQILGNWGGAAYTLSCMKLDRTNLVDGDTVQIQLYSDTAQSSLLWNSTALAPFAATLFSTWPFSFADMFFTPVAGVKSFKITTVSASAFQASRLFLGAYSEATYNPKYGLVPSWPTNSTQVRRDGGSLGVNRKSKWRSVSFDMFCRTEADRAFWMEVGRYAANELTVWVSVFPGNAAATLERDISLLGKFEESPATKFSDFSQFDFSLKINET